ncbi:DoxX family membrane protein [Amycolatopsis sp. H20-H5]|uniref:DoxX family membrane protein n=1 Tax=Amycolatopsis sp. H20-H5 TaxID=3046309 RepID=UPI002DB61E18|nr:DoxX family membrane protein [Amycolatopsis sp. H20-H5]MEC3981904.1 DoxX family membrane protein [Amycolatopsis sp. H20-H5]
MILRRVARPLLASIFIFGGIGALRDAQGHAKAAEPFLTDSFDKLEGVIPEGLPRDPVTLVRIDAGVKIGAGLALATGKAPRLASLLLLGSLVPTTLAAHRFWEIKDPAERQQQQIQFIKNASLGGGLLLAAADTGGKPSLGWRARRAAKKAGKAAERVGKRAEKALPN